MSSQSQQVSPGPMQSPAPVDLAARTTYYSSTAYIGWGFVLVIAATLMILLGSSANDDGTSNGDLQMVGVFVGVLGSPLLLVGLIAAGVRIGLKDHATDQERRVR